jgi:hypothetical protein
MSDLPFAEHALGLATGLLLFELWGTRQTKQQFSPSLYAGVADMDIVPKIVEISLLGEGKVLVTFSDDQVAIIEPGHIYTLARDLRVLNSPPLEENRD